MPKLNRYIPHVPTAKQTAGLLARNLEALYGGAAGGGKSDWLLMGALQNVDVRNYRAILFRKTFTDLVLPDSLMDRARQWLSGTDAVWVGDEHCWHWPQTNATVGFGYLATDADVYRYQSSQFQFIGLDELTQFTEWQFRYMFSRLRRPRCPEHKQEFSKTCSTCHDYFGLSKIPLKMRGASNPGGIGHDWVKHRFIIEGPSQDRIFIPANIKDNPFLDEVEYTNSLMQLDPVTRRQLLDGDWSARSLGGMFRREKFKLNQTLPRFTAEVRYWDLAATAVKLGKDPDYTVGVRMGITAEGLIGITDVRRMRGTPFEVEKFIRATAETDTADIPIVMEQESGASGVNTIDHYAREVLRGFKFIGYRPTGKKEVRAGPFASYAEAGYVTLKPGDWTFDYLDELEAFPDGSHDDQVDASSGAFEQLSVVETPIYLRSDYYVGDADDAEALFGNDDNGEIRL